jgi:pyruvate/2-oxoglutarate dehydrogenase complex dihydrolipoamide acyltransferase (E2) component
VTQQIEIKVPDIGDFSKIPVIEVLVVAGELVEAEQSLLTLESDKATMEIPAPVTGVIRELRVSLEDTVSEGDVVAIIEAEEIAEQADTESETPPKPEMVSKARQFQTLPSRHRHRRVPGNHHRCQWVRA